jgi:hypothetical protein
MRPPSPSRGRDHSVVAVWAGTFAASPANSLKVAVVVACLVLCA